jgi:hypothetical protein
MARTNVSGAQVRDGDITTADIAINAVTNPKLAQMSTKTYKGRTTAGTGDPEDISLAQLKTDLNIGSFKTLNGQSITGVGDIITVSSAKTDNFTGNGSTTAFVLTEAPVTVDFIFATVNGIMRYDFTYAAGTRTLTFGFAPGVGHLIYIKYIKQLNTAVSTTPSLIADTTQLTTADVFVIVTPGTVNYSITLPAALDYSGREITLLYNKTAPGNTRTVNIIGGNILGQPGGSYLLEMAGEYVKLYSDGVRYWVTAE